MFSGIHSPLAAFFASHKWPRGLAFLPVTALGQWSTGCLIWVKSMGTPSSRAVHRMWSSIVLDPDRTPRVFARFFSQFSSWKSFLNPLTTGWCCRLRSVQSGKTWNNFETALVECPDFVPWLSRIGSVEWSFAQFDWTQMIQPLVSHEEIWPDSAANSFSNIFLMEMVSFAFWVLSLSWTVWASHLIFMGILVMGIYLICVREAPKTSSEGVLLWIPILLKTFQHFGRFF